MTTEDQQTDYSKYLGPDWEPEFDGASTLIFNHTTWMDILVGMCLDMPAFLS